MFNLTFAGRPCFNPLDNRAIHDVLALNKPRVAAFTWANSLHNPLGEHYARGWLLMQRADLNAIDLNALNSLVWTFTDQENVPQRPPTTITAYGLVVTREPINLTPSNTANDPSSLYLVEVSDVRWRVRNPYFSVAINRSYNVPSAGFGGTNDPSMQFTGDAQNGGYMAGSLNYSDDDADDTDEPGDDDNFGSPNIGVLWTWQTMVTDIWEIMGTQLGPAPDLPFSPDINPEGFVFIGLSAWQALCTVLDRIGCAVQVDLTLPPGQQCDIVQVGADDDGSDAVIATADADYAKIHDAEFQPVARGLLPENVRVFFHVRNNFGGWETTPILDMTYSVDVATGVAGA